MPERHTASGSLLLVLAAVVSVQFGGAIAATLVPVIGAAGSVVLRLGVGAAILLVAIRPALRGHSAAAWRTVVLFGLVLGAMNWTFYASLARLPIGVAVTIEFIGPLTLAAVQSRRIRDLLAVAAAAGGILLISQALTVPWGELDLGGIGLALLAGTFWTAYIVLSQRTGAVFPGCTGWLLRWSSPSSWSCRSESGRSRSGPAKCSSRGQAWPSCPASCPTRSSCWRCDA